MTTTDQDRAFYRTVGERLKARRTATGWTQATLAERAQLSPNFIARLERGELGMSLLTATRLCTALAVRVDVLLPEAA